MFRRDIRDGFYMQLLEERHAPAIFAASDRDREHLRQWLPWVDKTTCVDHTLNFVKSSLQSFANKQGITAGIWSGDEYAGTIGTYNTNWMDRKAALGYWIASKFQGRGIVTDACRLLIGHVFHELDLNRVEIYCAPGNVKSCAIPKRLGFQLEGVLREAQLLAGKPIDLNLYAMLAREWKTAAR